MMERNEEMDIAMIGSGKMGGNSDYKDTMRRAARVAAKGLHFVDAGTSGGIWSLAEGYSVMDGGDEEEANHALSNAG
jgi:6-phosphogluconate dehydrogenase (decarboxylating)